MERNWADERYVRLYTRDTINWLSLSFEAQGLLSLLLRKANRAGVIHLGKHGKKAVAVILGHPQRWSALAGPLEELLADGAIVLRGEYLLFPSFQAAQEARATDAARQRAKRERERDQVLAGDLLANVTPDVTPGHAGAVTPPVTPAVTQAVTPDVTPNQPYQPYLPETEAPADAAPPEPKKRRKTDPPNPRWKVVSDLLCAAFFQAFGVKYGWGGAKDSEAQKWLLEQGTDEEILARWWRGLHGQGWLQVRTVAQLRSKWNDLAGAPGAPAEPRSEPPPAQPDTPAGEAWQAVLAELEAQKKSYALTWLVRCRGAELVRDEDGGELLVVDVPDRHFRAWVHDHYAPLIAEAAAPRRVQFRAPDDPDESDFAIGELRTPAELSPRRGHDVAHPREGHRPLPPGAAQGERAGGVRGEGREAPR